MAIYLVNQGKTYKYERNGGYLWSPKRNKEGNRNAGYSLMKNVKKGDYIIHNSGGKLSSISVVEEDCQSGIQPKELKLNQKEYEWDDEGWLIYSHYYDFTSPLLTSDLVAWAKENYKENSAFQVNGRLRLQYLCNIETSQAEHLLGLALQVETQSEVIAILESALNSLKIEAVSHPNPDNRRHLTKPVKNVKVKVKRQENAPAKSDDLLYKESSTSNESKYTEQSDNYYRVIDSVLKTKYPYGFKKDSVIEMIRFRQFAEVEGVEVETDDEQLRRDIELAGVVINDKVFWKNDRLPRELMEMIDSFLLEGHKVVYYERLFEHKYDWMASRGIYSEDLLKEYLKLFLPHLTYSKQFFVDGPKQTEKAAVTSEIIRVWGDSQVNNVDTLSERLPFIPLDNIWRVISGNKLFAWASTGEYLFVDRFILPQEESESICSYVKDCCNRDGFAFLKKIDISALRELNYELNDLTIYQAIFKKCLSDKYYQKDTILTEGPSKLTTVDLLKRYLKNKGECSFEELSQVFEELTGSTNRQNVFLALYDEMVRIDKNHFVSSERVDFRIKEIDTVINKFVKDHFLSLQDITSFAMFPVCDQVWNHYLLGSYCYRFSRKYRLVLTSFNDKNSGIIVEKTFTDNYDELLALAVARSTIPLEEKIANAFLVESGYLTKKKYAQMSSIVSRARDLRKER